MSKKSNFLREQLDSIRRLWIVIKEDTNEVYNKFFEFRKRRPRPQKRLNFWVGTVIVIASSLSFYVVFPLLIGMVSIIYTDTSSENVVTPSNEAVISFILISAALGALMMWFIRARSRSERRTSDRMLKFAGKCFLFAALSLSLFMLLSPILPTIKESNDLWEMTIKTVSLFSFLGGCVSFVMADVIGLLYIWSI